MKWLTQHLRTDWKQKFWQSWTVLTVLFWAAVNSLLAVWSALEGQIPTWLFVSLGFLMNFSVVLARLRKKQDDTNE